MARKRSTELESALFVRLPAAAVDKLDRAAGALGVAKKDLVAGLVAKYVDPDSRRGLSALGVLSEPSRVSPGDPIPIAGSHSFRPYDQPEVLSSEQAAQLLQVEEKLVVQLAEAGELPGRKLGKAWRFSQTALIAWLSTIGPRPRK
jgi:excisionase family DNA binding protein